MSVHSEHRPHSHAGSFFFGVLVMIVAIAAVVTWFELGDMRDQGVGIHPAISMPVPELPAPPGVIPNSGRAN